MRLPLVKLYRAGERNDDLLDTILANVRVPEEWRGDVEAKIAGCWRGEQEMHRLLDKYGLETFDACCDYLIAYAERETRAAIANIPDGRYVHSDSFEDDGFGTEDVALPLMVALEVDGESLTIDFTGSAAQVDSAINCPLSMTKAAVFGAVKAIVHPDVLVNEGFARPLQIIAPPGSLLNAEFPAAVGGRASLFFRIFDMMFRALAQAVPVQVPVPGEGGDVLHFTGQRADGQPFALLDLFFGGWGARPGKDGIDGTAPMAFGSYGTIPTELLEREYPIVVEHFGYIPDSGGAGKYRGSLSVAKQWRFLAPGKVMVRTNRTQRPSDGLAGGKPGTLSQNVLHAPPHESTELARQTHLHLDVSPGDRLHHVVSGSGDHGDPWQRALDDVLADVKADKVTIHAAREQYGVVIDPQRLQVETEATASLRQSRAGMAS